MRPSLCRILKYLSDWMTLNPYPPHEDFNTWSSIRDSSSQDDYYYALTLTSRVRMLVQRAVLAERFLGTNSWESLPRFLQTK